MIKDKKVLAISLTLGLSGIVIFYLVPFIVGLISTFIETSGIDGLKFGFLGFEKYISLFKNEAFILAMVNTAMFTIIIVFLVNIISFLISCFIKYFLIKSYLLNIIILPLIIPTIVIALVIGDILSYDFLNMLKSFFHIAIDIVQEKYAFFSIILIYLWKYTGFNTLIYITALSTIPKEQFEAASIDGAGKLKKLYYIILPYIFPFICFNVLLSITNSFRMFRDIYILFGDYPPKNVYLVQHFIQNNFTRLNIDYVYCAAYVFFGIIFAVFSPLIITGNRIEKYYDE